MKVDANDQAEMISAPLMYSNLAVCILAAVPLERCQYLLLEASLCLSLAHALTFTCRRAAHSPRYAHVIPHAMLSLYVCLTCCQEDILAALRLHEYDRHAAIPEVGGSLVWGLALFHSW